MGMRAQVLVVALLGAVGCAGGTVDEGDHGDAQMVAALSMSVLYQLVTPAGPGSTGPLALRRANAVPTALAPTYGAPTVPAAVQLASDAQTTQAALDAVLAIR